MKYVYLARASNGAHKIGWSRCPTERMKSLPSQAVLVHQVQTEHATCVEGHLHRCFEDKRISGEWFDLEDADVAYILSLTPETIAALLELASNRPPARQVSVRIPPEMDERLQQFIKDQRIEPTDTAVILAGLDLILTQEGYPRKVEGKQ